MASGKGKSTEADTLPVCSVVQYFKGVEFLGKWSEDLRGEAFWKFLHKNLKLRDFTSNHVHRSWQVEKERAQKLLLYQFVVPYGTLSEWSFSENDQRTYAEKNVENCLLCT